MHAISSFRRQNLTAISKAVHCSDGVDWMSRNCNSIFYTFIITVNNSSSSSSRRIMRRDALEGGHVDAKCLPEWTVTTSKSELATWPRLVTFWLGTNLAGWSSEHGEWTILIEMILVCVIYAIKSKIYHISEVLGHRRSQRSQFRPINRRNFSDCTKLVKLFGNLYFTKHGRNYVDRKSNFIWTRLQFTQGAKQYYHKL